MALIRRAGGAARHLQSLRDQDVLPGIYPAHWLTRAEPGKAFRSISGFSLGATRFAPLALGPMHDMGDRTDDNQPDNQADGRWMTFKELAAARGITKLSAVALVRRHGWRRQRDNQGHVRALVPLTWANGETLAESDNQADSPTDNEPYSKADMGPFAVALAAVREAKDGEISILREQVAHERSRSERAEARNATLEAKVGEVLRQVVELEARVHHESRVAKDALELADQLRQADIDRKGQGRWARLRAAWRRE